MEKKAETHKPYEKPTLSKQTPEQAAKIRKPYKKPTTRKLTPEQVKLKLLSYANMGDQGAKELLELAFPDLTAPPKYSKVKSKSV